MLGLQDTILRVEVTDTRGDWVLVAVGNGLLLVETLPGKGVRLGPVAREAVWAGLALL